MTGWDALSAALSAALPIVAGMVLAALVAVLASDRRTYRAGWDDCVAAYEAQTAYLDAPQDHAAPGF